MRLGWSSGRSEPMTFSGTKKKPVSSGNDAL